MLPATAYSCGVTVSSDKKYYFRVKETDLDGRSNTSKTVWIDKLQQGVKFVISPNPVQQVATLTYSQPVASEAALKLLNNAGVVVWQNERSLGTSGTVQIPMSHLPAGTYHLQIMTPKTSQVIKVVKE